MAIIDLTITPDSTISSLPVRRGDQLRLSIRASGLYEWWTIATQEVNGSSRTLFSTVSGDLTDGTVTQTSPVWTYSDAFPNAAPDRNAGNYRVVIQFTSESNPPLFKTISSPILFYQPQLAVGGFYPSLETLPYSADTFSVIVDGISQSVDTGTNNNPEWTTVYTVLESSANPPTSNPYYTQYATSSSVTFSNLSAPQPGSSKTLYLFGARIEAFGGPGNNGTSDHREWYPVLSNGSPISLSVYRTVADILPTFTPSNLGEEQVTDLSAFYFSPEILVSGLEGAVNISITGGAYSYSTNNGVTWSTYRTSILSQVNPNGWRFKIRTQSGPSLWDRTESTLYVGTGQITHRLYTVFGDNEPDSINLGTFTTPVSTKVSSNRVLLTGFDEPVDIYIARESNSTATLERLFYQAAGSTTYTSIGIGNAFTNVQPGSRVYVEHQTSGTPGLVGRTSLYASGSIIGEFRTENSLETADTEPDQFSIGERITNIVPGAFVNSSFTLTGINTAITVTAGENTLVSLNNSSWFTSITAGNNTTIYVRITAGSFSTSVVGSVSAGGVSASREVIANGNTASQSLVRGVNYTAIYGWDEYLETAGDQTRLGPTLKDWVVSSTLTVGQQVIAAFLGTTNLGRYPDEEGFLFWYSYFVDYFSSNGNYTGAINILQSNVENGGENVWALDPIPFEDYTPDTTPNNFTIGPSLFNLIPGTVVGPTSFQITGIDPSSTISVTAVNAGIAKTSSPAQWDTNLTAQLNERIYVRMVAPASQNQTIVGTVTAGGVESSKTIGAYGTANTQGLVYTTAEGYQRRLSGYPEDPSCHYRGVFITAVPSGGSLQTVAQSVLNKYLTSQYLGVYPDEGGLLFWTNRIITGLSTVDNIEDGLTVPVTWSSEVYQDLDSCLIGDVSGPSQFSFSTVTNAALNTNITRTITISGLDPDVPVLAVASGAMEIKTNTSSTYEASKEVQNGTVITASMLSSPFGGTSVYGSLNVNGVTADWTVTTTGSTGSVEIGGSGDYGLRIYEGTSSYRLNSTTDKLLYYCGYVSGVLSDGQPSTTKSIEAPAIPGGNVLVEAFTNSGVTKSDILTASISGTQVLVSREESVGVKMFSYFVFKEV